ncbi:MAG: triose-phosphate isomerase [Candidatus Diapherotrites archaeon]
MKFPILFINFKCYEEATDKKAVALAKKAAFASKKTNSTVALVVQATDIRLVSSTVTIPVFAQHLDPIEYGSHTGHILPEAVRAAGAKGTVLNHAENKQENSFLEKAIVRAHSVGLKAMVCAESTERARAIAAFSEKPDFIAIEPPELIGGDISVSTAKPSLITDTVIEVKKIAPIPVITGAGIKNSEDVRIALELGTSGVFVASGIVKASDQKKAILELLKGFK